MALHFTTEEFQRRERALAEGMAEAGVDAVLLFAQESMYWLTGYDTFGFCFFQCLVMTAEGRKALLTRSADLRQAQHTSTVTDIRIWRDAGDANPTLDLRDLLDGLGLRGKRLGVEYDSYGLTAFNGRRLDATLDGFATLADVSPLVPQLRSIKSAEEIAYVRQAAVLADAAHAAALEEIRPGADEGAILARQHDVIFRGGGDYPGNEFIIGSGRDALLCRYKAGRRTLANPDQITLEFAGVFRHYHAAIMHTVCVGAASERHRAYHAAGLEALAACAAELRPGRTAHDVFMAHARTFDARGLAQHRLNACGYSLGAKFTPSWMDPPMLFDGNKTMLKPDMVMFVHMILMDSDSLTAMCLGRTYLIGAERAEALCGARIAELIRN